jgi:amino acid adenylation domain-containing protein
VAVHLACEAIWRGECKQAMAGGVNALLLPDFYIAFSQLGVLSPDGRCKTFDAQANGYVRSEGAGMVLLKPLSQALIDSDRIYAVIRGTAVNQDGRTPGLTVPNQAAQESLIESACRKAGVQPFEIGYVEAHGTGTPVGDPIEAAALGAALGRNRRPDEPCWIGSVKTNIGHLEAGAGIASLIKVALALKHRRIPKQIHFASPNPNIDFPSLGLRVATESQDWNTDGPKRLAGVNGFGYGGTNAHVIMEEVAETPTMSLLDNNECTFLPFSAKSESALNSLITQFRDWITSEGAGVPLKAIASELTHRRSHFDKRMCLVATSKSALSLELQKRLEPPKSVTRRETPLSPTPRRFAFVFCGQGSQWCGMGQRLLSSNLVFRRVIEACDREFRQYGEWSLIDELVRDPSTTRIHQTAITQPSLFAIQVALSAVWSHAGIKPSLVVGHSVGEIAAAYVSGALSWEDACRVAYFRGRTMDRADSRGAMLAVGLSSTEVHSWISNLNGHVSIAAVNGPQSITLSGEASHIVDIEHRLQAASIFCKRLAVEYAFHSSQMDPVRFQLLEALRDIRPNTTRCPFVSTVTGDLVPGSQLDANYWWRNVRETVRFADAMTKAMKLNDLDILEIGPHPVLAYSIQECVTPDQTKTKIYSSIRRNEDETLVLSQSIAQLYEDGFELAWDNLVTKTSHGSFRLPFYPFQYQRYWIESRETRLSCSSASYHPLLGNSTFGPMPCWQSRVDLKLQSYLRDHRVRGATVYPAAAVIESAIQASVELQQNEASNFVTVDETSTPVASDSDQPSRLKSNFRPILLQRLVLHSPCVLSDDRPQWIECRHDLKRRSLDFHFRDTDSDGGWSHLATVTIASPSSEVVEKVLNQADIEARCVKKFDRAALYEYCARMGLDYGPRFQGVASGVRGVRESLSIVELPATIATDEYTLHPAFLDSCFHTMIAADDDFQTEESKLKLPAEIAKIFCRQPCPSKAVVHTRIVQRSATRLVADIDVFTVSGEHCASLHGFESRAVNVSNAANAANQVDQLLYRYHWIEKPLASPKENASPSVARRWLVIGNDSPVRSRIVAGLSKQTETSECDLLTSTPLLVVDYASCLQAVEQLAADASHAPGIIYLGAADCPTNETLSSDQLWESRKLTCLTPVEIAQTWERISPQQKCRLLLPTFGAQIIDDELSTCELSQAAMIGLGRVLSAEYSRFETTLVDFTCKPIDLSIDELLAELSAEDDEDEVLYRTGKRFVRRFDSIEELNASPIARATLPYRLQRGRIPNVEELDYQTEGITTLESDQVEIEVRAAGLNFSDVMKAIDLYPGLTDARPLLGAECAGIIRRVGGKVTDWKIGDAVMAVAPGALGNRVLCSSSMIAPIPAGFSFEEAASIPIAFLTADYALDHCGAMRSGDRVLIHAASGGVGQAALQIAKSRGATLFATCGSEEKRRFVASQGVSHVMNSRDLSFAGEIMKITEGEGIDLVLNSLPGEAIAAGLSVLKPSGRFLEIGKRDIYGDAPLGLYPMRNNLAFFAIDLDQLFKLQPKMMGDRLRQLVKRFESGELESPPYRSFLADQTQAAFRLMQQSKHIGKIVVTYPETSQSIAIRNGSYKPIRFRHDASYWIVGGLGGFGIELAEWLARHGAGTIILSSRRTKLSPDIEQRLNQIRELGSHVVVVPLDLANGDAVRSALDHIRSSQPVLRGVFHTAMVLEDKLLVDLDSDTLDRVLSPKLQGGWNLHEALQNIDLDHFVLFSSLTSIFGHAGQANYAAANAFLDSLAHYRQARQLPALVINWGHLGGAGYIAHRTELSERLERQGVLSFSVKQAFDCLESAIQRCESQVSVLRMDWTKWRGLGTSKVSPKFAHLIKQGHDATDQSGTSTVSISDMRSLPLASRAPLVAELLKTKVATLLGATTADVQTERAFVELGLDSLMAVELRNWIESRFEESLPISAIMRSSSVNALGESLAEKLGAAHCMSTISEMPELDDSPSSDRFPMSAGQKGLWYAFRRDPKSTAYNVFLPTRIQSSIDLEKLREAIELVVARHASLRTTFSDDAWNLTQQIHPELKPEFRVHDMSDAEDSAIRHHLVAESQRPFDLELGPLLRICVIRMREDDWVVMAVAHHIVVDFWSLVLVLDELREIYPCLVNAKPINLPDPTNRYARFVASQSESIASPKGEREKLYWQKQLEGIPSVLELPCDFQRPPAFSGQAAVVPLSIGAAVAVKLVKLASDCRVTNFAVIMAVLQVLLSKYSSQHKFVVGTPFAGRGRQEYERTVGFFVNMLPIKADVERNPTFEDLVSQVGQTLLDAMEHEDYPLASIVQDLHPARDPSRSPLFQVSCTLEKSQVRLGTSVAGFLFPDGRQVGSLSGLVQETFYVPHTTCHHDLEFVFDQDDGVLNGMLIYCRDLFDEGSMAAFSQSYCSLMTKLVDSPKSRVLDLELDTFHFPKYPAEQQTLLDLLDEVVSDHHNDLALRSDGKTWTYAELDAAIDEAAKDLAKLTVSQDSFIPIYEKKGPIAWIEILAAMRSGNTPIPLDCDSLSVNLNEVIADTDATVGFINGCPKTLDPKTKGPSSLRAGHAAYLIYTSGSTGRPNGVVIDHPGLTNLMLWKRQTMPLDATHRVFLSLSHQFDAAMGIVMSAWTQGAEIVIPDKGNLTDIEALIQQIRRDRITVLAGVPSWIRLIIEHHKFETCDSIQQIWTGGESLSPALAQQILDCGRIRLWNLYGPTETTIEATAMEVKSADRRQSVSIGQPIANTSILIFDNERRCVPKGAFGEIAIFGPGVARGYWQRDQLTAERFIEWSDDGGEKRRGYLSGDFGRIRHDGSIEFMGRYDEQIKLRGFRLELNEIEAVALMHPDVQLAAAVAVDTLSDDKRLILYVVLQDAPVAAAKAIESIRELLTEKLAAFKQPSSILVLPHFPRTVGGKIDRQQLARLVPASEAAEKYAEPRNGLERCLAEIWREVLGIAQVSRNQNFFDLGGSSLQAARMTSLLSRQLGLHVPTALVFDLADIAGIARRLIQLHPDSMRQQFQLDTETHECFDSITQNDAQQLGESHHPLLVPLKSEGEQSPLFMIHPPGGFVVCYRELAKHISPNRPLIGIRSRGLYGTESLPSSLEEMAAEYVQAIRSLQPHGPYVLGGWSLGGIVAFEVAQQLTEQGEAVESVFLLDSAIPESNIDLSKRLDLKAGAEYGLDMTLEELGRLNADEQLPFLWQHARNLGLLRDDSQEELAQRVIGDLKSLFSHHVDLCNRYRLRYYNGRIVLIRPREVPIAISNWDDRGWRDFASKVDIRIVGGHHHSMVQPPNATELGNAIEMSITQQPAATPQ